MARGEGFGIMDVSTDVANDPKFRRIQRQAPELVAPAFAVYIALMAESWKAGRRVSIDDGWPAFMPFDPKVVDQLTAAGLVDRHGLIALAAWQTWFMPVRARRAALRERWSRANANRHGQAIREANTAASSRGDAAVTARLPRGSRPDTAAIRSVPSVPSERKRTDERPKGETNGRDLATCPGCGDELHPGDPGVRADRVGQLWHEACPPAIATVPA
jgi:hypothetical protein